MKYLILPLLLISFVASAGQCGPEVQGACNIISEDRLPSGRSYRLDIEVVELEPINPLVSELSGYWGANGGYPDTYVKTLSFHLNGRKLWLPAKTYSDLGNLISAEVKENDFGIVLLVHGGNAATAYYATYVFNEEKVRKRTVRARAAPDQSWEKTTFAE